jgi:hypothetical protein
VAYIGTQPLAGQYRKLDDISGGFNGSTTSFTTSVGGTNVTAGSPQQLLVSLGGVIQQPTTDYTVNTSTIIFTTAPASGLSFFAILMGDALNTSVPADGSITSAKLAGSLDIGLGAGSASTPSLFFSGDANTGIYSPGADQVALTTAGTARLYVSSAGLVGIGVTSPDTLIHGRGGNLRIDGGATGSVFIAGTSTTPSDGVSLQSTYTGSGSYGPLMFFTSGSERARIDSSGRLLVGTSTADTSYYDATTFVPQIQLKGSTADASSISLTRTSTTGAAFVFQSGSSGNNVASGGLLGEIIFSGFDGANYRNAARIEAFVDATPGSGDMPGRLVFSTTPDGLSSTQERMRLSQNGRLNCQGVYDTVTAGTANVVVDSNGLIYRSSSSAKYKTQIETAELQYSEALLNCRPVWYRSLSELDNPQWGWWGFIAEEVAQIDPRLVHWRTTETVVAENGSIEHVDLEEPIAEGVQYDRFVPHLLNLIKRQGEAIADLQAEVSALKGA